MAMNRHVSTGHVKGDNFSPREHFDTPYVVNPTELIPAFPTKSRDAEDIEEGKDFYLKVNLYGLDKGDVYVGAILFNGPLVDQVKQHLNENGSDASVLLFTPKKAKSGKTYHTVVEAPDADFDRAAEVDWEGAFASRLAELTADQDVTEDEPEEKPKSRQSAAQKAKVEEAFSRS